MSELNLSKDGVMRVAYSEDLKRAVNRSAAMWEVFSRLPLPEKMKLATSNQFNGSGYEVKINDHISADRKENFDVTSYDIHLLLSTLDIATEAIEFIESIEGLSELAVEAISQVGDAIPTNNAEGTLKDVAAKSAVGAFFRFLHYPAGAPIGAIIAEPHADHSGITLHLSESTDGCEMLSLDKRQWEALPVASGEAIAFGGMQSQLASEQAVTALCHRVIASQTTAAMGRFAVVCFTPLDGFPAYDRSAYGRLQDKEAGFNYPPHQSNFYSLFTKS